MTVNDARGSCVNERDEPLSKATVAESTASVGRTSGAPAKGSLVETRVAWLVDRLMDAGPGMASSTMAVPLANAAPHIVHVAVTRGSHADSAPTGTATVAGTTPTADVTASVAGCRDVTVTSAAWNVDVPSLNRA